MAKSPRRKKPRPDSGLVLSFVREVLELEQTDVAEILEVTPGTVSDYERGEITKTREEIERIAAKVGEVSPQAMDLVFEAISAVRRADGRDATLLPIPIAKAARAALVRVGAQALREIQETLLEKALAIQVQADRRRAQRTWGKIEKAHPKWNSDPKGLRRAVERQPDFATWAFADLLAERGLATAPELPKIALVLGELALQAAKGATAAPIFLDHLQAKALATIGNARRVLGFLPDSERAFLDARRLWPVGAPSPGNILSEARLFDLEASLRRDQRRFSEAHERLDRAFALTPAGPARGRLYLKQSSVFEQEGNFEGSIGALRNALTEFGEDYPIHHRIGSLLNLAVNLDHLGRHTETLEVIPVARQLAIEAGSEPNLLRLLWLEARTWAALGRRKEAIAPIEQVRRDFAARGNLLDVAFVGLELAALYLEEGRTADTRQLALELTDVFLTLGIKRERLAAVWLFLESAVKEAATAELARKAAAALRASFPKRAVLGR
jgi:tetratricopeptide (TPR) repeat protein